MFEPRSLTLGQEIELPDGLYVLTDFSKGVLRLRNELTHEYRLIDHLALADLLPPGRRLRTEFTKSVVVADTVDGLDEAAAVLVPHLEELLTGKPAVGEAPREQYNLALPATRRRASKLKELKQDHGIVMDDSSLKRKLKRYREQGAAGLVDLRSHRKEKPTARIENSIVVEVGLLLEEYRNKSTPSATALMALLKRRIKENYPVDQQPEKMISLSTLKRLIHKLDRNSKTLGSARQRQANANQPKNMFSSLQVTAPGDEAQIDSTKLDVFVRMPDGSIGRPTLTILVDKRTRSILGFNLTPDAQNAYDHSVLLAHALVPRQRLPWARHYDELELPPMPWSEYLTEEQQQAFDIHRPYIIPRRIITDNGQDYLGKALQAACGLYGIHLTEAPYASPTSKAIVERTFGTIRSKFCVFLPGYSGGRSEFRGVAPAAEDVLDIDTVAALFDRWVAVVWQNRRHDGLVDPFEPSLRHTPNTMYAASVPLTGHFMLALEPEDYLALMPRTERNVHADGIEFRGRNYDSPLLAPYREYRGPDGKKRAFDVHYDPSDIYHVWLRTPEGEWIGCEWTEALGLSRPNEKRLLTNAHKLSRQRAGLTDAEADDLTLELRDEVAAESKAIEAANLRAVVKKQKEARIAPKANVAAQVDPGVDDGDNNGSVRFTSLPAV